MFHVFPLAVVALLMAGGKSARAQDDAAEPLTAPSAQDIGESRPRNLLLLLNGLKYDTDNLPPLIVVDADRWLPYAALPEGRITMASLAEASGQRLVPAGNVRALVPRTMDVLTDKLGKANPFGGMRPDETLKLLLGTLTHAQWQLIGGVNGIGLGDLTDDQRLLWDEVVPEQLTVQKSILQPGDEPRSWRYTESTLIPVEQPDAVRIRLNKQTTFQFYKSGSSEIGSGGDPYQSGSVAGQTKYILLPGTSKAAQAAKDIPSAYGVALITKQANRLKPSAIDYDSPSLDAPISLHFPPGPTVAPSAAATAAEIPPQYADVDIKAADIAELPADVRAKVTPDFLKEIHLTAARVRADAADVVARRTELPTIADLLLRISKTTRVTFVADRRVRDSRVYLRGDSARSGDVLQALARSVTGSFRKIEGIHGEAPVYLLTYDREGVGARAARISEWAEAAEELKRKTMDGVVKKIGASDPLSALTFAPDDKYTLGAGLSQTAEENWQSGTNESEVRRDDLPPGLKDVVDSYEKEMYESGVSLRNDRIRVSEQLGYCLIVLGIGAIPDTYTGQGITRDFLRQISADAAHVEAAKNKAANGSRTSAAAPPLGFPAKLRRRVLLAKPGTPDDAAALVRVAARKGITDIWLAVSLADMSATAALLQAATKAGAGHIAVGASVPLLRQAGGIPGEPERDIQGETGDESRTRLQSRWATDAEKAEHDYGFSKYEGWIVPDRPEMTTRLKTLASLPGLTGMALLSTAAPGWTGEKQGGDDILTEFGYSLETRRQFLDSYGMDPIDIVEKEYPLRGIAWDLGLFHLTSVDSNYIVVNHRAVPSPTDAAPRSAFLAFRARENVRLLAALYTALKEQSPRLPLFLDDRVSPYGLQRPLSWIGSWDAGDRVPINPPFSQDSEGHAAARQASKTIFADWGWWWSAADAEKEDAPASFAIKVTAAAYRNGPPAWDGMALDMSNMPSADLIRLLGGLPDATAP